MRKVFQVLMLVCCLTACNVDINFPLPGATLIPFSPSRTPHLVTGTPARAFFVTVTVPFVPSASATATMTSIPIPTPALPDLGITILGCDTSLDLSHQMGEVTNAYVSISNTGQSAAGNVCAVLSSSDEGRPHPDKIGCVLSLPARTRVTLKLTVDTGFGVDSRIQVQVSSAENVSTSVAAGSCKVIGAPAGKLEPFGVVEPIP
jgi:hypothetical protein